MPLPRAEVDTYLALHGLRMVSCRRVRRVRVLGPVVYAVTNGVKWGTVHYPDNYQELGELVSRHPQYAWRCRPEHNEEYGFDLADLFWEVLPWTMK